MHLIEKLQQRSPASVRVCALLNKQARRRVPVVVDYFGFQVEDVFVVGYGLDFDERYRGLSDIYVLPPE
jgi:hypoxanthine phosphoribosyltransferase